MPRRGLPWTFVCSALVLTASVLAAAPQRALSAKNITGVWETRSHHSNSVLILNADGSGEFNGKELQWKVSGSTLSLTFQGGATYSYSIVLAGNSLTVSSPDLKQPLQFTRSGSDAPAAPANPLADVPSAPPSGGRPAGLPMGGAKSRPGAGPVGRWETDTEQGVIALVLNPDGSGTFGSGSVRWVFSQGVLTLTGPNGKPIPYPARIGPDSMTLTDSTSGAALTFRKVSGGSGLDDGGQTPSSQGGSSDGATGDDEGYDEGEEGDELPGQAPRGVSGGAAGSGDGSRGATGGGALVGSWRNQQGMTLQLNADGSAILNGQRYHYLDDGSTITFVASDGQMPFPYTLSGNTMTVMVQGQPVVYTRAGGGAGGKRAGGLGGGGNPPDMVGTWCWINVSNSGQVSSSSNNCFVLNPDGTYEYSGESSNSNAFGGTASQSSDRGTWQVEGSQVHVSSQQQGQVTYQLEKRNHPKTNDPMLCLDGSCFVTYGQKPPWPY
jgi:hypothetical protein